MSALVRIVDRVLYVLLVGSYWLFIAGSLWYATVLALRGESILLLDSSQSMSLGERAGLLFVVLLNVTVLWVWSGVGERDA